MNGRIFKIFGAAILIFNIVLVLIYSLSITRFAIRSGEVVPALIVIFGFLLISTVIAAGLIELQRWAAITASVFGLAWSLIIAFILGSAPWPVLAVGLPVVFGMLTPLYATIRYWPTLKSIENPKLRSFGGALRSLDPLHLE